MKCIKNRKECKPSVCFKTIKNNYICSGISRNPSHYSQDKFWLCGRGKECSFDLEMTKEEALLIVSALCASLGREIYE